MAQGGDRLAKGKPPVVWGELLMPVGRVTLFPNPPNRPFEQVAVLETAPGETDALLSEQADEGHQRLDEGIVETGGQQRARGSEGEIRQQRANRSKEANRAYLRHSAEQGFLEEIRGNPTPMLVIIGEYDMEPFTEATARRSFLEWYPNAELAVCRNAGHYPQQEAPVYVASVIDDFLARHATP